MAPEKERVSIQRGRVRQAWNLDQPWRNQRDGRSRRLLLALCGVIGFAFLAFVVVRWATAAPTGGDPNGQVLKTLRMNAYSAAKITGVDHVEKRSYDSVWITNAGPCGFGQTGWSPTVAQAAFASSLQRSAVLQQIELRLAREGWKPNPAGMPPQTDGAVKSWQRELDGQVASVSLWQVPPEDTDLRVADGQSEWNLGAVWQPQPRGVECP